MAPVGLGSVRRRIAEACSRSGRPAGDVTLVAVSKHRSDRAVLDAYDDGQRVFGENREQELRARIDGGLPGDIEWHFIGPLQSRKVSFVGAHVDLLQSLDRMKIARRWAVASTAPVLIEFNLAAEPQKSGFDPADAPRVIDELLALGLSVQGVMAIPPVATSAEDSRAWFRNLRSIFDRYRDRYDGIVTCSMGMTNDFEVAIEEGATMVRVGRAIFDGTT
jgi:PLP dependent protein